MRRRGRALLQPEQNHVRARIGLPPATESAGPTESAHTAADDAGPVRLNGHRHAEAEALVKGCARHERKLSLLIREAVAAHHPHGFGFQYAHAIELAFIHQHTSEAQVVVSRGDQSLASRDILPGLIGRERGYIRRCELPALGGDIERGQARALLGRHPEAGVDHAQRRKQLFAHRGAQILPKYAGCEKTQHVDGVPVVEALAGLKYQRQLRQGLQPAIRCQGAVDAHAHSCKQRGAQRRRRQEAISQSGAMRHQVLHSDRALRSNGVVERAIMTAQHPHLC